MSSSSKVEIDCDMKVPDEDAVFERGISMRYHGQWRSLQVKMGSGPNALREAVQLFHEEHEKQYAFRQDDTPVEIYQLHLKALGRTPKPTFKPTPVSSKETGEPIEVRDVYFDGQWHSRHRSTSARTCRPAQRSSDQRFSIRSTRPQ